MTCHLNDVANKGLLRLGCPQAGTVNVCTESSKVDRCVKRTPVDQPLIYILSSTVHTISDWMHLSAGTRDLVVWVKSGYFQPT